MPDDFFDFLVATGQLDDFLGYKDPNETNEENDEDEKYTDEKYFEESTEEE